MNSCSVQSPFFEESRSISAIPSRSDITVIITSRTIVQLSQCRSFIDDPSSNASKIRINNLYTDALCCAGCAQFRSNNNRIGRVGGFIRARLCMQIGKRLSNHDPHEARVSVTEFREVIKWRVKRGEIRSGIVCTPCECRVRNARLSAIARFVQPWGALSIDRA